MIYMVHDRFKDVFVEILKTPYRGPKYKKVKVLWWNVSCTGEPYCISRIPETITIQNEDWFSWKYFDPSKPETHPGRRQNVDG